MLGKKQDWALNQEVRLYCLVSFTKAYCLKNCPETSKYQYAVAYMRCEEKHCRERSMGGRMMG